jgi:DNA-binding CsgD family transcriptional regulator
MTAPLQVIAFSFSLGADFEGRILQEVDRLKGRGVLRVLDMLFVAKDAYGAVERLAIGDDEDFGSLLAGILPGGGDAAAGPAPDDGSVAFDLDGARDLAESLEPGTALAYLLIEHNWAAPLFDAIAETGGALIGEGFLDAAGGLGVRAEVAAMEEAAEVIAEAQAAEADALLRVIAAGAEAAVAEAASEQIQAAAAAEAIRALIEAGLVEEAAAHEAVTALTAAGLLAAAADQATEESLAAIAVADDAAAASLAEDAAIISAADEVAAEAADEAAKKIRAASITVAEAQVLRYLPTSLPFAVIADKLGISRSAAKERAERLYKRLGVHSRADAVSRARAVGLIRGRA